VTGGALAAARAARRDAHARARRLQWVTIACLAPSIALVYFAVGPSQGREDGVGGGRAESRAPTIGSVEVFGRAVSHGWVMIAVLALTSVPLVVLGEYWSGGEP
jgi:hypothetical protein